VAFGIGSPAVLFLLSVAGAMEVETAFALAKWSGLGLIGLYGFAERPLLRIVEASSQVFAVQLAPFALLRRRPHGVMVALGRSAGWMGSPHAKLRHE
jgi:hypothetical protein